MMCLCNVWDNRPNKKKILVVVVDKNWIAHTCVTNTIQNTTDNKKQNKY